jgi:hypothetical protein
MVQLTSPPVARPTDETIDAIVYGLPEIVRAIAVSRNSVTSTLRRRRCGRCCGSPALKD